MLLSPCVYVQYLADVQEHLGETIVEAGRDVKVPSSEYDGKVVYGEKRKGSGTLVTAFFMWQEVTLCCFIFSMY